MNINLLFLPHQIIHLAIFSVLNHQCVACCFLCSEYFSTMKGKGLSVVPISSGVRYDLEELMKAFMAVQTVRYDHFALCFKEMGMAHIFA